MVENGCSQAVKLKDVTEVINHHGGSPFLATGTSENSKEGWSIFSDSATINRNRLESF